MDIEKSLEIVICLLGLANELQEFGYSEHEFELSVMASDLIKTFAQEKVWNKEHLPFVETYCSTNKLPALLKVYKNAIGEKENG